MSYIVVTGRVAGGFIFYGPFKTETECESFIERARKVYPTDHHEVVVCLIPAGLGPG